jgi:hypothetical protein
MKRVVQTQPTEAWEEGDEHHQSDSQGPARDATVAPSRPEPLRTEFDFELPRGYVDANAKVHKLGTMRLATARDELLPLHDDRVRENPAYQTVVILARVITRLGDLGNDDVRASVIENLFASDLRFLQELYKRVNTEGHTRAAVTCPACHERFTVDLAGGRLGEQ